MGAWGEGDSLDCDTLLGYAKKGKQSGAGPTELEGLQIAFNLIE